MLPLPVRYAQVRETGVLKQILIQYNKANSFAKVLPDAKKDVADLSNESRVLVLRPTEGLLFCMRLKEEFSSGVPCASQWQFANGAEQVKCREAGCAQCPGFKSYLCVRTPRWIGGDDFCGLIRIRPSEGYPKHTRSM